MGRPREFDLEEALETAMETFWASGYGATSLGDLMEAMQVHKASLYQAFGNKRSLYLAALERYQFRVRELLGCTLGEAKTAKEGIREWFLLLANRSICADSSKGCFLVNTIVELTPHDQGVRDLTLGHIHSVEKMFRQAIERGQQEGGFRADLNPSIAARFLIFSGFGLYVAGKSLRIAMPPQEVVDVILSALE